MPFTLAHPAAILPFRRWCRIPGALSALVIGSMSPDFVYFLALDIDSDFSHSLEGLFLFCLPASFVVFALFHLVFKRPLTALLPARMRGALQLPENVDKGGPFRQGALLLAYIFLGACTHVVWDDFTHADGFAVRSLPLLRTVVDMGGGWTLPGYRVLQYGSSVLGLLFLWRAAWQAAPQIPRFAFAPAVAPRAVRTAVLLAVACAGAAGALHGWQVNLQEPEWEHVAFRAVVNGMKYGGAVLGLFALAWHAARWSGRPVS